MPEHAHTIGLATFLPLEGRRDDLVEVLRGVVGAASDADGCFGAQVCEIREQPQVIAVISRWQSREAVDAFVDRNAERVQGALGGLVAEAPTALHYQSVAD